MKKFFLKIGFYSGLLGLYSKKLKENAFRILVYHHVTSKTEPFVPHITVETFSRQIEYLNRHYSIVSLDEVITMVREGKRIPPGSVALTFDDEYEDIYHNAFPLLRKLELPALFFIATGFVDTDRVPWTDEIGFLFRESKKNELEIPMEGGTKRLHWNDQAGKLQVLKEVKKFLKTIPEETRVEIFKGIKEQLAVGYPNPMRILNGAQIEEMAASGISFGAHTVNHCILTRVPLNIARREIEESKSQLEELTGRPARGFSYPNGEKTDFNAEIKMMVQKAGYDYACTTLDGVNKAETDLYELKRIWTTEPSLPFFAARLARRRHPYR